MQLRVLVHHQSQPQLPQIVAPLLVVPTLWQLRSRVRAGDMGVEVGGVVALLPPSCSRCLERPRYGNSRTLPFWSSGARAVPGLVYPLARVVRAFTWIIHEDFTL